MLFVYKLYIFIFTQKRDKENIYIQINSYNRRATYHQIYELLTIEFSYK